MTRRDSGPARESTNTLPVAFLSGSWHRFKRRLTSKGRWGAAEGCATHERAKGFGGRVNHSLACAVLCCTVGGSLITGDDDVSEGETAHKRLDSNRVFVGITGAGT